MRKILTISLLFLISQIGNGQSIQHDLKGSYIGLWLTTFWTYKFNDDHSATFTTELHFGPTTTACIYFRYGDTVFVKSVSADKQADNHYFKLNDTLLIEGEKYLFSITWKYKFCKYTSSDTIYSQN